MRTSRGRGQFAVKVFGERNTGTKYLEQLLVRNFDVVLLPGVVPRWLAATILRSEAGRDLYFRLTGDRNLGWKHSIPDQAAIARAGASGDRRLLVATITKNPYSWLVSLHRRPYHARSPVGSLEAFLSAPWTTVSRERAAAAYPNPIHLWNAKNGAYARLGGPATVLNYRFEDVLSDPLAALEALATSEHVPRRAERFRNVVESTNRDREHAAMTNEDYRAYYLDERWREHLSLPAIEFVNEQLDRAVVAHFGYELLSP